MEYIALLDQGEGGCDYTIHCGRDWWFFDAKDDNEAFAKLRARMFTDPDEQGPEDGPGPYIGETKLQSVTLIRIAGMAEVNVKKWYKQYEDQQTKVAETEEERKERAEYERLKVKFELTAGPKPPKVAVGAGTLTVDGETTCISNITVGPDDLKR